MKDYRAVIFDFDMTLADTALVIVTLLNEVAGEFGYPAMPAAFALPIVGYGHEIMLSHVTGEKEPEKLHVMRDRYRQICRERMPDMMVYFPDVPETLRRLKGQGLLLGILSQKPRAALAGSLEKYNLAQYIDVVTGCEDAPAHKPDPGGLLVCAGAMGLGVEQILYIGDHLVDQETARAAGMDFSAMLRGTTAREEFDPALVKCFYHTAREVADEFSKKDPDGAAPAGKDQRPLGSLPAGIKEGDSEYEIIDDNRDVQRPPGGPGSDPHHGLCETAGQGRL